MCILSTWLALLLGTGFQSIIIIIISGSAVALHCCKAYSKINRKMGNSTPCKIVTPKNFNLKLCTRDYIGEATHHANFGSNRSLGASPHIGEILPLCDFLFWLSCPVQSCPFFRERAQVEPLNWFSRFMAQTTCFHLRKCLLGVRMMGDVIWGKYAPQNSPKMGVNRQFQAKTAKYKNYNISESMNPIKTKFEDQHQTTIALRGCSNVIQIKYNMAAGRRLEKNRYDVVTTPRVVRFWRNTVSQCRMIRRWRKLGKNRNR